MVLKQPFCKGIWWIDKNQVCTAHATFIAVQRLFPDHSGHRKMRTIVGNGTAIDECDLQKLLIWLRIPTQNPWLMARQCDSPNVSVVHSICRLIGTYVVSCNPNVRYVSWVIVVSQRRLRWRVYNSTHDRYMRSSGTMKPSLDCTHLLMVLSEGLYSAWLW